MLNSCLYWRDTVCSPLVAIMVAFKKKRYPKDLIY